MSGDAGQSGYEQYRDQQARISRERAAQGKDIGPLPGVVNPKRRSRAAKNLKTFCSTYLGERFFLRWSKDHLSALAKLQKCGLKGGLFAFAMPRGSGKTALCEATAIWALLYGHRRFVMLVGATETAAEEMLESIQTTLETNDLLAEDFPEVCQPIRSLEGISNRANGQTCREKEDDPPGPRTRIVWTNKEIVFPTIKDSVASGAILRVAGLTGRLRGQTATTADGKKVRPDFVLADDPQTDESASSPVQNATRERLVNGAILRLAGPKSKIAVVMPMTVIAPGDLADRYLDRDRYPQWQGERSKMLVSWPANKELWETYAQLRKDGMSEGGDQEAATKFYRANRAAMDEGAEVSWPDRYLPGQASAIEHAMCRWIDNRAAFMAEDQNEPMEEALLGALPDLDPDAVANKLNRLPRGTVPREATRLVCGIDVQPAVLYWLVAAWREDYGGAIVDYGAWPRQNRSYFASADARPSLADQYPGLAEGAAIYAGLADLVGQLAERAWPREGVAEAARLERIVIDANYAGPGGTCMDAVYQFCRQSAHRDRLLPSHGKGIGARNLPIAEWPKKEGQRKGRDWVLTAPGVGRGRHVNIDTNSWKSFVAERLRTEPGAPACLWLPGDRPHDHQLLADHICAEHRVQTEGRGRVLEEWVDRPDRRENHWWDCLVLCAVAASIQGLAWSPTGAAPKQTPPRRKTLNEMRDEAIARRKAGGR